MGVIGAILGIVLGAPGIYWGLHEKKANIVFEVISEANVVDLYKPLQDVDVLFKGESIKKQKQNLKIFTITVANRGEIDVLQSLYEQKTPWGIQFKNAKIVDTPRIVASNSEYLSNNVAPVVLTNDIVEFTKVIFEKGKFFTLEIMVLFRVDAQNPDVVPIGKIAGIEEQQVIRYSPNKEQSFWSKLFYGSVWLNLIRACFLAVSIIVLLVLFIGTGITITEYHAKRETERVRKSIRERFPSASEDEISSIEQFISLNVKRLKELRYRLKDDQWINEVGSAREKFEKQWHRRREIGQSSIEFHEVPKKLLVRSKEGKFVVNERQRVLLDKALEYLEASSFKPAADTDVIERPSIGGC